VSTALTLNSLPQNESGKSLLSSATIWAYGSWVTIATHTKVDIYIYSLQFQVTSSLPTDTNYELLFDIGVAQDPNTLVTKLQVPYSFRNDTALQYYQDTKVAHFPEPFLVPALSRVAVRVTDSVSTALTYNGVKLRYMSSVPLIQLSTGSYPNSYQRVTGGMFPVGTI
jgi:hypothetical protein